MEDSAAGYEGGHQLTKWCAQSDINFIRFARFVITGEGKDELKNELGQIRME